MASWRLLGLMLYMANVCYGQTSYEGWSLVKVHVSSDEQVQYLKELTGGKQANKLQVWKEGNPCDIFLSPAIKSSILAKLDNLGIMYNITMKNAQSAINTEKIPQSTKTRLLRGVANAGWFTKYQNLDGINEILHYFNVTYPNLVQVQQIGKGSEGNPIYMAKVSSKNGGGSKPAILLDGGIHAREWVSPSTVLFILNKLITDPTVRNMVDRATWYIIPVLNPDGYAYTHNGNRLWRKNRRKNKCDGTGKCCVGVDLNRNFDYSFGGLGTSADSCSDTYRGPYAFSEPESTALKNVVERYKDIKAYVTLHSYSQMWFYPYGDRVGHYPPNQNLAELKSIATNGAAALRKEYGKQYKVGTAADILYPAAGGSDDWAKGKAGIPYVFCLELRPDENAGNGFLLPTSQIVPTAEETWAGLNVVANTVINKYR